MSVSMPSDMIDSCFRFMQNWDSNSKKEMIVRLLHSLDEKTDSDFSDCFGAWQDDRSAEEIVEEIYANRRNCSNQEIKL